MRPEGVISHIYGWVCIGLAAAFGAWIWPFRRGLAGLAMNAALGVFGAVGAGTLAVSLGLLGSSRDPLGLPIAALGALVLLVGAHLLWSAAYPSPRRHAHMQR